MENVRYTQIEWYNELLCPHHLVPMVVIYLYPPRTHSSAY